MWKGCLEASTIYESMLHVITCCNLRQAENRLCARSARQAAGYINTQTNQPYILAKYILYLYPLKLSLLTETFCVPIYVLTSHISGCYRTPMVFVPQLLLLLFSINIHMI